MTRVHLHPLPGPKRAGELTSLVERLHRDGQRIVVWVADDGRRKALDDYLWTYRKLAFLPHVMWASAQGEVGDPVVLVGEPSNPNRAAVLVVGDEPPPAEWASGFEHVHDFLSPDDAGASRREAWHATGLTVDEEEA